MYHNFNLQMFGDPIIEGIDEDILKELADELPEERPAPAEENSDNKSEQEEKPADDQKEEPEQKAAGEEDSPEESKEGTTIPYQRFKEVNDRMKQAEARVKELEEAQKQKPATPAAPAVQAPPAPAPQKQEESEFSQEALQKIAQMAIANVRAKNNIDDESLEAMEYSDDPAVKLAYQNAVQEEVARIKQQAIRMAAERREAAAEREQAYNDYAQENAAFMKRPDNEKILAYIQKDIQEQPSRQKNMLLQSIARLSNKQGTYQDLFVVQTMVGKYIADYEAADKPPAVPAPAAKNKKVAGLPTAPDVQGTPGAGEFTLAAAERMIDAGEWDRLPKEVQDKILRGAW